MEVFSCYTLKNYTAWRKSVCVYGGRVESHKPRSEKTSTEMKITYHLNNQNKSLLIITYCLKMCSRDLQI